MPRLVVGQKRCTAIVLTLDVQPLPPSGKILNITLCLILAHWPHGVKTRRRL